VTSPNALNDCRLCAISAGQHAAEYDRPVVSDVNYFGMASVGGFIPGWALLCPRKHSHNLASAYSDGSFHSAISLLVGAIFRAYGEAAIFEHGSISEGSKTACGTSHAHLHVAPFGGTLADIAVSTSTSLSWERIHLRNLAAAANGSEYLFVANRYGGPETVGQLARLEFPRSQFFRRLLADYLRVPHLANYRDAPLEEASIATAVRLRAAVTCSSVRAA